MLLSQQSGHRSQVFYRSLQFSYLLVFFFLNYLLVGGFFCSLQTNIAVSQIFFHTALQNVGTQYVAHILKN